MFDKPVNLQKTYGVKPVKKRTTPTNTKPKSQLIRWDSEEKKRRQKFAVEANYQENLGRWYRKNIV